MKKNVIRYIVIVMILSGLLGVGYASVSDSILTLNATATLNKQEGIFITGVSLTDSGDVDPNLSEVNLFYQTMLNSKVVLSNDSTSYVTYEISITNQHNLPQEFKQVVFDNNFYDNPDISFTLNGLAPGDVINPNDTVTFDITFQYADSQAQHTNTILNSVLNFHFEPEIDVIAEKVYPGQCVFNGRNNDVVGDCAEGQHVDYLNTGIALFDSDNYLKDFELGFTIDSIDPSRFRSGQVDTIFSCLHESSPYPGIALRIQDSKWLLQVGSGIGNNTKLYFDAGTIQSFKLYRKNGNVYYQINGEDPVFVRNLNTLSNNFNDKLTVGTSLENGIPMTNRFLVGEISDFYVRVTEPEEEIEPVTDYSTIDQQILDFVGEPMTVVYDQVQAHTFDGTADSCFNTNVALFDQTNYQKSFIVSFIIEDDFALNAQSANQATLFNAKDESGNGYPGVMMRRNSNTLYTLSVKDGNQVSSSVTVSSIVKRVNIIKKGMLMYYQTDFDEIEPLGNSNDISSWNVNKCFNTGSTFGSIIDGNGDYNRIVVGSLSNMKIQMGA